MNKSDLKGKLPLLAQGKVRELYKLPDNKLLFVATDRISAYDVILGNGIPDKGRVLTALSRFWFDYLKDVVPNHLADHGDVIACLPESIQSDSDLAAVLKDRALVVNRYKILPLEVIVRGYITGSAWNEYKKTGTVHGTQMPAGLQESQAFPTPIYTPSTKAEQGEHDENISPEKAAEIVGKDLAAKVEQIALALYKKAHDYAQTKGIIIADTKFEFGVDESGNVVLVDEVLTPDSSRFWPKDSYKIGQGQDSYDKQYVRDWLVANGLKGVDGVSIPEDVANKTREKYLEVYEKLVKA
ncbi:Phosphoribosylaminoimidazole-succinocarboxamide synthase [Wickerhamiella sorbophila]|uniref:Phosphoribosylaminoimidazole-succinocarboxamide synthase n=1 Tax=Wickerhamiella sorbophila TaxID=45607 RepID=A0A2T0FCF0_9ASCO|nr:Phosphoribosylaminoimidazole-succinocarboxamide synthase [Wickerhamiella sorbophila]PRT52684.1 Phosphoribosylaminoimidazole-succinocarboxamide synthase [Wickerhamiella sorbophila]